MFKCKAFSGLNVQDREIKRSVKNVPFVICLPAPGASVHSSYEYTQLIRGCSLPAEPPQPTQPHSGQTPGSLHPHTGWWEPPSPPPTHRHPSPPQTNLQPQKQLKPPGPFSTEDTQTPEQHPSIAVPLFLLFPAHLPASPPHPMGLLFCGPPAQYLF